MNWTMSLHSRTQCKKGNKVKHWTLCILFLWGFRNTKVPLNHLGRLGKVLQSWCMSWVLNRDFFFWTWFQVNAATLDCLQLAIFSNDEISVWVLMEAKAVWKILPNAHVEMVLSMICYSCLFVCFSFLAASAICGSSWARDWIRAGTET